MLDEAGAGTGDELQLPSTEDPPALAFPSHTLTAPQGPDPAESLFGAVAVPRITDKTSGTLLSTLSTLLLYRHKFSPKNPFPKDTQC